MGNLGNSGKHPRHIFVLWKFLHFSLSSCVFGRPAPFVGVPDGRAPATHSRRLKYLFGLRISISFFSLTLAWEWWWAGWGDRQDDGHERDQEGWVWGYGANGGRGHQGWMNGNRRKSRELLPRSSRKEQICYKVEVEEELANPWEEQ